MLVFPGIGDIFTIQLEKNLQIKNNDFRTWMNNGILNTKH